MVTTTSGTAGGIMVGSSTIEWVVTNTSSCGFFQIISQLNSTGAFLPNIPYDITGANGIVVTKYPVNKYGNWYYPELDPTNAPYLVSVSDVWLNANGYVQLSPDFTITNFDPSGMALGVPMIMSVDCSGTGITPNLAVSSAAASQFIAPLQQGNVSLQICNISCGNYANSIIQLAIPSGVTPDLSNLSNATFSNDTVTITEAYLSGCMNYGFPCSFAGNTPAGTVFDFHVTISAQGEQDFLFNEADFSVTVQNSYDPNDKQCQLPLYIQPDVQERLSYTVRFQNDGNFPALNVVVRDTISNNLDLSTFRLIGSSHPVSYTIDPITRELVCRFGGIQLMSSLDSLEGSQGYFTYELKELPNLPLNSEIQNTAYIFFDFNPAIVTNTTQNINGHVGLVEKDFARMEVYPNPSEGQLQLNGVEEGQLFLTSMSGQIIWTSDYQKGDLLDFSTCQPGLYLLRLKNAKGEFVQKVNLRK